MSLKYFFKLPSINSACITGRASLSALGISLFALTAQADILISPQRAVLTDNARQAVISLHNPGSVPRAYKLTWVERQVTEDGQVISLKDGENPRSITSMVRFSPRSVTVDPGQTQTVRLDYRPPANLKPGEYRSHLRIGTDQISDKNGISQGTEVMRGGNKDGLSFRIEAMMSFSVPIFVRHGLGSAEVRISAIEHIVDRSNRNNAPALKVTLSRSGEFSSYGRLAVYQQLDANSPVELIGEAGSVAIYTEVNRDERVVNLNPEKRLVPGSWLRVSYEGVGEERGKVFAEQAFQIGK
jgi:P pilus assembly chaperone PapD